MINWNLKEGFTSENLYNKVSILEVSTLEQFGNGLEWIKNNNINSVLVGGTALVHYLPKSRDLTPDIDVMVDHIDEVIDELENSNIRFSELKDSYGNDIGVSAEEFNIDFLDMYKVNPKLNKEIMKNSKIINIGGEPFKIIAPELLAIMKLSLGREKDIKDGIDLLKSGVLNIDDYLKYLDSLKDTLDDYESLSFYSQLIESLRK